MTETLTTQVVVNRATMKDVAALAQVSLKTVSRVINDEPTVNPELAERVRKAAAQLRYQPNFGASALRRSDRRSSQIAVLLEDLANPFSATIYRAVEEIALQSDVTVLGGSFEERTDREHALVELMTRHRVDGMIIAPASDDHQYLHREQEAGVPFVFIDRPPRLLAADAVMSNSREGALTAVEHLLAHGHRRIAYLGDFTRIYTAQERLQGYVDALAGAGLAADPSLQRHDLRSIEDAMKVTTELLSGPNPPTAVFTGQNLVTIGAVRAIRALGLQHTVALVGFDDFLLADLLEPGITVVAQDAVAIGRAAAAMLFKRLGGSTLPPRTQTIATTLIERGSGELRA